MRYCLILLPFLLSCSGRSVKYSDATERGINGPVKRVSYRTYKVIRDSLSGKWSTDTTALLISSMAEYNKKGFVIIQKTMSKSPFGEANKIKKVYFNNTGKLGDSTFDAAGRLIESTQFQWINKYSYSLKVYDKDGAFILESISNLNKSFKLVGQVTLDPDSSVSAKGEIILDSNDRPSIFKLFYPKYNTKSAERHYSYFDFDKFNNPQKSTFGLSRDKVSSITYFSYEYY